jgi:hypothetical protein
MPGLLDVTALPEWYSGAILSASALQRLRDTVLRLDGVSVLPLPVFISNVGYFVSDYHYNPTTIWRGGVTWRAGATTLAIIYEWPGSVLSGDRLVIRRQGNGAAVEAEYTPSSGIHQITITPTEYTDLEVVRIDVRIRSTSRPSREAGWPNYVRVLDVWIQPIQPPFPLPSLPTYGQLTEANLQATTEYARWLLYAYGQQIWPVPSLPFRLEANVTYTRPSGLVKDIRRMRVYGSGIRPSNDYTELFIEGEVFCYQPANQERIYVAINGVESSASYQLPTETGLFPFTLAVPITAVTAGQRFIFDMYHRQEVLSQPEPWNRVTIRRIGVRRSIPNAPALYHWQPQEGIPFPTLQSRLNDINTQLLAVYNRYAAATSFYQRQTAGTARTAKDDEIFGYYEPVFPLMGYRRGEALIVRGQSAQLVGGALTKLELDEKAKRTLWDTSFTLSLVSAPSEQTVVKYFDTVPWLPVGAWYAVRGQQVFYAAEWLGGL